MKNLVLKKIFCQKVVQKNLMQEKIFLSQKSSMNNLVPEKSF